MKPAIPKRKIKISTKFDPNLLEPTPYNEDLADYISGWSFVASYWIILALFNFNFIYVILLLN